MNDFWFLFSISYEALIVLIVSAVACALIGTVLVLRSLSMVADALSHTVLLGIVVAFFIVGDLSSPFLILSAAAFGVLTVFCIEQLSKQRLLKRDDAVGLIFPLFFSLAVILISKFARNVHLDTDVVLMGEVILTPLTRIDVLGISLPKSFVFMTVILLLNITVLLIFYKEIKILSFDPEYAKLIGFSATLLFYFIMSLTSLTAVTAFDALGSILVISFLIAPGASAYLLAKSFKKMLLLSSLYAIVNACVGFFIALLLNLSVAGTTACIAGLTFMLTVLFNRKGLITQRLRQKKDAQELKFFSVLQHIANHEGRPDAVVELSHATIHQHLAWSEGKARSVLRRLQRYTYVKLETDTDMYSLTKVGIEKLAEIKTNYQI